MNSLSSACFNEYYVFRLICTLKHALDQNSKNFWIFCPVRVLKWSVLNIIQNIKTRTGRTVIRTTCIAREVLWSGKCVFIWFQGEKIWKTYIVPPWSLWKWRLVYAAVAYDLPQMSHLWSLIPSWMFLMWIFMLNVILNDFSQNSHL